jgi:hypothetical protein
MKMNHQQWKEWINLLAYEELDAERTSLTEDHLNGCQSCRQELDQLKRLHRVMDNHAVQVPTDALLQEARQELRAALRIERNRAPKTSRLREWFSQLIPTPQVALGFAAMLVVGLFAGYAFFKMQAPTTTNPTILSQGSSNPFKTNVAFKDLITQPGIEVSNIRFMDADTSDGQVEFAFDAYRPMSVKGNINDPEIQQILTYALVKEQNDGVRLRAVNTIAGNKQVSVDSQVKEALITALKRDSNDAVRKEAMAVLKTFPFDKDIQEAFLYVLERDANAALRIEAIKSLENSKIQDKQILNVLKERSESDDNSYIRRRAKDYLKEVSQQ